MTDRERAKLEREALGAALGHPELLHAVASRLRHPLLRAVAFEAIKLRRKTETLDLVELAERLARREGPRLRRYAREIAEAIGVEKVAEPTPERVAALVIASAVDAYQERVVNGGRRANRR